MAGEREPLQRTPAREHEDVDLSILACDLSAFREHVGDEWNLWSNHGGTLRPFNDRHPEVLDVRSQVWVRRSAADPWVVDLVITPDRDGLWASKPRPRPRGAAGGRDLGGRRRDALPAARGDAAPQGRGCNRPKDDADLAVTWPLLGARTRDWLREACSRSTPSTLARADGLKPQAARAQASACALSSFVESPSSRRTTPSVWAQEKKRAVRKVRTRSHSAVSPRVVAT